MASSLISNEHHVLTLHFVIQNIQLVLQENGKLSFHQVVLYAHVIE